ncbi:MAG: isoprenylcysteine carboxylmethyltransferase family protein [Deltaproteobacteria bacterium]|nr:isoprenylcysteine carboxylmethyltransferase family protein [Deltaproteobacteria bacterium]
MHSATMGNRPDSPDVNLMPPTVFFSCLVLGGVLEFFFPINVSWLTFPIKLTFGFVIGASGFTFMMFAHEKFKRVGTPVPTNQPASTLVVRGAYRFSRNPMYVGGISFFFGIGISAGSLWILAAALLLSGYISLFVVPSEEAYVERTFGQTYRDYCQNVRRWL